MTSPFTSVTGRSNRGLDAKFRINQRELQQCIGVLTNKEVNKMGRLAEAAVKKAAPVGVQRTYSRGAGSKRPGRLRKAIKFEKQESGFLLRIDSTIAPHAGAVIFGRRSYTMPKRSGSPYRYRSGGGGRMIFHQGGMTVGAVPPNDFVTPTFEKALRSYVK